MEKEIAPDPYAICPKCENMKGYPDEEYCLCAWKERISRLEAALREIIEDCTSNWISAQMIAGIARRALKEGE